MLWFPWRMVRIRGIGLSFFFLFSSSSLISLWIRLEFNFFCFVPLIRTFQGTSCRERESISLYFIFQRFFSLFFLSGFFLYFYHYRTIGPLVLFLSILGKIGCFPFYFWIPPVLVSLSYEATWILLSIQKLGPIALYLNTLNTLRGDLIFFIVLASFLVRGVGGFNQSGLRPFLAFSSIAQRGWFMLAGFGGTELFLVYFLVYAITLKILLRIASHQIIFLFFAPYCNWQGSWWPKLAFLSLFFSLGGLPPFPGFFIKFLVIWILSSFLGGVKIIILVRIAGFTLFFYVWYSLKGWMVNNIAFLFTRSLPLGNRFLSGFFFFSFWAWSFLLIV